MSCCIQRVDPEILESQGATKQYKSEISALNSYKWVAVGLLVLALISTVIAVHTARGNIPALHSTLNGWIAGALLCTLLSLALAAIVYRYECKIENKYRSYVPREIGF